MNEYMSVCPSCGHVEYGPMGLLGTRAHYLKQTFPRTGETDVEFAKRLYSVQMDVYSAHAGVDLYVGWEAFDPKSRLKWVELARKRKEECDTVSKAFEEFFTEGGYQYSHDNRMNAFSWFKTGWELALKRKVKS